MSKLEAELLELNKLNYINDEGNTVSTVWGIDDRKIKAMADMGYQLTTIIPLATIGRGNIILGAFYRRVEEKPEKKAEKPKPKAKAKEKKDA